MRAREHEARSTAPTLEAQPVGAAFRVVGIDGGRRRVMRLLSLGVRTGAEVTVTQARGGGVVVACETGRIAIGPEMARHIHVEEVS